MKKAWREHGPQRIHLEDEICADLAAAGWLCEAGDNARYDRMQEQFANSATPNWTTSEEPEP